MRVGARPTAPVIETDRLVLRGARREDLEPCHAIWSDPEYVRPMGGLPTTREESWTRLVLCAGLWPLLGYGFWLIEERASERVIGDVGAMLREREMTPPLGSDPEIGWGLAPLVQRRGLAVEAVSAALRWLDESAGLSRQVCVIDPENTRSISLAAKVGFEEIGLAVSGGGSVLQFQRRRPQ